MPDIIFWILLLILALAVNFIKLIISLKMKRKKGLSTGRFWSFKNRRWVSKDDDPLLFAEAAKENGFVWDDASGTWTIYRKKTSDKELDNDASFKKED